MALAANRVESGDWQPSERLLSEVHRLAGFVLSPHQEQASAKKNRP
jgi:hypothetical protein